MSEVLEAFTPFRKTSLTAVFGRGVLMDRRVAAVHERDALPLVLELGEVAPAAALALLLARRQTTADLQRPEESDGPMTKECDVIEAGRHARMEGRQPIATDIVGRSKYQE